MDYQLKEAIEYASFKDCKYKLIRGRNGYIIKMWSNLDIQPMDFIYSFDKNGELLTDIIIKKNSGKVEIRYSKK